jgi:hypothetical protein
MRAAVLAAAMALLECQHRYPVRDNPALTFHLPPAELTAAELEQEDEEVQVAPHAGPSWLPAGTPLPAPDPQGPAEVGGVVLRCCWAMQEAAGPCVLCCGSIRKWKTDPLVVCEENLRCPGCCTTSSGSRRGCLLVGPF